MLTGVDGHRDSLDFYVITNIVATAYIVATDRQVNTETVFWGEYKSYCGGMRCGPNL